MSFIALLVFQEIFVSIRFISNPPALLAVLALPLWISVAQAQTPAPAITMPDAAPAAFRSALEGYQPYTDEKTVNWKEANDTAGRIGGWRAYAKEARQPEPQAPAMAAKPDPRANQTKTQQEKP